LYTEPGIEATACARELLYVYVYVYVIMNRAVKSSFSSSQVLLGAEGGNAIRDFIYKRGVYCADVIYERKGSKL